MLWDDELESLANIVRETLGKDAFAGAHARAWEAMVRARGPLAPGHQLTSMVVEAGGAAGSTYDASLFYDALKVELRRLLRPH